MSVQSDSYGVVIPTDAPISGPPVPGTALCSTRQPIGETAWVLCVLPAGHDGPHHLQRKMRRAG